MTVDADWFLFDVNRDDTGIVFEEVRGRTRKLLVNLKFFILDSDGDCCAREASFCKLTPLPEFYRLTQDHYEH